MGRDYRSLRDPNAEYTTRDLSAEAMGATAPRGPREVEITDVQTTMVHGKLPSTIVVWTSVISTSRGPRGAVAPIASAERSRVVYSAFGSRSDR